MDSRGSVEQWKDMKLPERLVSRAWEAALLGIVEEAGFPVELESGAKVLVKPDHFEAVTEAIRLRGQHMDSRGSRFLVRMWCILKHYSGEPLEGGV